MIKLGDKVRVSPELTGLGDWVEAVIIEVEDNHFNGVVIYAKTFDGVIYFGRLVFFEKV